MDLKFQNFRLITPQNLLQLSEIHQRQFALSGEMCYGEDFDDPLEIFAQTYGSNCELWEVIKADDPEQVLYEVWVFDVDTACVFYAETDEDTGVGMIQSYFEPIEIDTKETQLLSKDLQKAFDEKEEPDYLDPDSPAGTYKAALKKNKENASAEDEE